MSLVYKILWIDDQIGDITHQIKAIETFINGEGLIPHVIKAETSAEISTCINALNTPVGSFDLIVVDYKLTDGPTGAKVAKEIRTRSAADVVFYSATPRENLLEALYSEKVDGVYVAHRTTILSRVRDIISAHISWAVNSLAMRGISAGIVSEIDHLIKDILKETCRHDGFSEDALVKDIYSYLEMKHARQEDVFEKIKKYTTIQQYSDDAIFGSDARFQFLKTIWDKFPESPSLALLKNNVARYDEKVLVHRNTLTHGKSDNGRIVLGKRTITLEELREIRVSIRDHLTHFNSLFDQLRSVRNTS
jgi:DNA-binding NarL/FixJ family response regulator